MNEALARGRAVWTAALTAALAVAGAEATIHLVSRYLLGSLTWTAVDQPWRYAVSYLLVFGAMAVPLSGLAAVFPSVVRVANAVYLGTSAVSLLVLLGYPRIHAISILILAVGLAVTTNRWAQQRKTMARRIGLASGLTGAAVVALASGYFAIKDYSAKSALNSAPAAWTGAPNVLLIILDTVRAASIGLYGNYRDVSPTLDSIARHAVVADSAVSTSSWTLPAHGSMFTGKEAYQLSGDWLTPLDDKWPTLAEDLSASGYETVAFTANFYYTLAESGLSRGFQRYHALRSTFKDLLLAGTAGQLLKGIRDGRMSHERYHEPKRATEVTDEFLVWHECRGSDRPYFAFLNYFDAHKPYYSPAGIVDTWQSDDYQRDRYDEAIEYLDSEIDRLLAELQERGDWENTLVIITSDHGELFGEHGLTGHGNSLYWRTLHVPLMAIWPSRLDRGVRHAPPISLTQVHRLVELAADSSRSDASLPEMFSDLATGPMVAELSQGHQVPASHENSNGPMVSVIDGSLQYLIQVAGCKERVIDLADDDYTGAVAGEAAPALLVRARETARAVLPHDHLVSACD